MDKYQILAIVFLIIVILLIIVLSSRARIIKTYNKYIRIGNKSNLTGKQIAIMLKNMLDLKDLKFAITPNKLGDAYSPKHKTLIVSEEVGDTASLSSLAIVSHEYGHALQHEEFSPLFFINRLFLKLTIFTNKLITPIFVIGLFLFVFQYPNSSIGSILMLIAGGLFGLHVLHKILTIPLEYDASKRALNFINKYKLATGTEYRKVKKLLNIAAQTYVASLFDDLIIKRRKKK